MNPAERKGVVVPNLACAPTTSARGPSKSRQRVGQAPDARARSSGERN